MYGYSPPQRLEGNELPMYVDISGCVATVVHRNFYSEVQHSNLCQIAFILIDIDFVLINNCHHSSTGICSVDKKI